MLKKHISFEKNCHMLKEEIMKSNKYITFWNAKTTNIIIASLGIILILISILIGIEKTLSVIILSIGTSILASAIVSGLSFRYLIQKSNASYLVEHWGIEKIYETRAEINYETNSLLKNTKSLEICAMGLKSFRDAQQNLIEKRISEGMRLKILTISPDSNILPLIDETEKVANGSTKTTIESLIDWVSDLKLKQIYNQQIELKVYDHYPYDFYFCMDGIVFTGPYQTKTSQQTITYKYSANTIGASIFINYFNSLWEESTNVNNYLHVSKFK